MCNNLDLEFAVGDDDLVAKVANAVLDLDLVVEELFESSDIEDLVADRLLSVDHEFLGGLLGLGSRIACLVWQEAHQC